MLLIRDIIRVVIVGNLIWEVKVMQEPETTEGRRTAEIGNRLRALREAKQLTQSDVAKAIGVKRTTVTRWEGGTSNPKNALEKLANFYNVSMEYINNGKTTISNETNEGRVLRIPVLGQIAAGIPIEAIQDVEGWEEIIRPGAGDDVYYGLHIHGHSMEPRLYEGDTVIVKQTDYFEDGDMCIVLIGTEATVKIVNKLPDGILLRAYNEDVYQPHFYSAMQVETLPVRIIAVVIELRCKP